MQKERDHEIDQANEDFKNLIFANNPKMYRDLFMQPTLVAPDEGGNDIVVPETVGDVQNLLSDLKDLGLDLSGTEI